MVPDIIETTLEQPVSRSIQIEQAPQQGSKTDSSLENQFYRSRIEPSTRKNSNQSVCSESKASTKFLFAKQLYNDGKNETKLLVLKYLLVYPLSWVWLLIPHFTLPPTVKCRLSKGPKAIEKQSKLLLLHYDRNLELCRRSLGVG